MNPLLTVLLNIGECTGNTLCFFLETVPPRAVSDVTSRSVASTECFVIMLVRVPPSPVLNYEKEISKTIEVYSKGSSLSVDMRSLVVKV